MTYGGAPPTITPDVHRLRQRRHRSVARPPRRPAPRRPPAPARSGSPYTSRARARSTPTTPSATCRHGDGHPGAAHGHGLDGSMTYGGTPPDRSRRLQGLRERRHRVVAHDAADVLHHGHQRRARSRLDLRQLVLGRGRPQLHHHLRGRVGHGQPGAAHHHGLVGVDDLRRNPAGHHPGYSGFVNGDTPARSPPRRRARPRPRASPVAGSP